MSERARFDARIDVTGATLRSADGRRLRLGKAEVGSTGIKVYDRPNPFTRLTCSISEKLAQGAGIVALSMESQIDAYRESAEAFWSKWERDT